MLLEARAKVDSPGEYRSSPLLAACSGCYVEIACMLIEAGAAANASDVMGMTPLRAACHNGSVELVSRLLQARADRNVRDADGVSPLVILGRPVVPCTFSFFGSGFPDKIS